MDQIFLFFSWVDIHKSYYILEIHNQIWWFVLFNKNIAFLTRMTKMELKQLLLKIKIPKIFKKKTQKMLSMVMYM